MVCPQVSHSFSTPLRWHVTQNHSRVSPLGLQQIHGSRIKRILGVCEGRVFPANRASSGSPNESARGSAARRGLLYLWVSLESERALGAAIAVRQWSMRLGNVRLVL